MYATQTFDVHVKPAAEPTLLNAFTERQTRWRAGEATSCFGEGLLCNKCITVSKQPMLFKGPCDTCSITGISPALKAATLPAAAAD